MQDLGFAVHQYRELCRRLREADPEIDEDTVADTVEGLTNVHELLAAIIRAALIDEAYASGLKERIEQMEARMRRLDERAARKRQIARDAMVENEIKKIADAEFTVSVRAGTPALVVVEEGLIPSDYWVPREPRLDRQGLLSELKQGATIAGVALSNPEPVMSVRTK
jgi:DNA-binding transcriptional MerR regulator